MSDSELSPPEVATVEFLAPHKYPVWLLVAALILVLMVVYSLVLLPKYYSAARLLDRAENEDSAQHIQQAVGLSEQALQRVPDSKQARLQLAYECFKLNTIDARIEAMAALNGVSMDKDEWEKLSQVMTDEDRANFRSEDAK